MNQFQVDSGVLMLSASSLSIDYSSFLGLLAGSAYLNSLTFASLSCPSTTNTYCFLGLESGTTPKLYVSNIVLSNIRINPTISLIVSSTDQAYLEFYNVGFNNITGIIGSISSGSVNLTSCYFNDVDSTGFYFTSSSANITSSTFSNSHITPSLDTVYLSFTDSNGTIIDSTFSENVNKGKGAVNFRISFKFLGYLCNRNCYFINSTMQLHKFNLHSRSWPLYRRFDQ